MCRYLRVSESKANMNYSIKVQKQKLDDQKMKIFYMYIVKERENRFLETRVFVKYCFHSPLF